MVNYRTEHKTDKNVATTLKPVIPKKKEPKAEKAPKKGQKA